MSELLWTVSEQQSLLVSMQHFGACNCTPPGTPGLHQTCDGHSFLGETDRRVDRLQHLLYVRRTRQQWIDAEWMHMPPCTDVISPPPLPAAVRDALPAAAPVAPDTLPW
jgi:hypothetical protein